MTKPLDWLFDPRDPFRYGDESAVIQPIHRVEGDFADAWRERMTRPTPVTDGLLLAAKASVFRPTKGQS